MNTKGLTIEYKSFPDKSFFDFTKLLNNFSKLNFSCLYLFFFYFYCLRLSVDEVYKKKKRNKKRKKNTIHGFYIKQSNLLFLSMLELICNVSLLAGSKK